ncbi:MAG: DUF3999 family protein [Formosimonas sp.]
MSRRWMMIVWGVLSTSALALSMPDPHKTLQLPIVLNSTDSVHQLTVPTRMLVNSYSPHLHDMVVVNGQGQTVPMAWLPVAQPLQRRTHTLQAYLLSSDALQRNDYTQIQLNNGQVNITQSSTNTAHTLAVGALLDARQLPAGEYTAAVQLDIQTPAGQIVPLTLESSTDLRNWQTLAEAGVVQLPEQHQAVSLAITPTQLHGQYIRIRWPQGQQVRLNTVTVTNQVEQQPSTQSMELSLHDRGTGGLAGYLPPVLAGQNIVLHLRTQVPNSNVPVWIGLKNDIQTTQKSKPTQHTVVFHLTQNGQTVRNGPIVVEHQQQNVIELSAPPGQNLPADLTASIELPVRRLVFVASGSAPYVLRFKEDNADATRPLSQLLPNGLAVEQLPVAHIDAAQVEAAFRLPYDGVALPSEPQSQKITWLWAALIGGVVLLAGMIAVIVRQLKRQK